MLAARLTGLIDLPVHHALNFTLQGNLQNGYISGYIPEVIGLKPAWMLDLGWESLNLVGDARFIDQLLYEGWLGITRNNQAMKSNGAEIQPHFYFWPRLLLQE